MPFYVIAAVLAIAAIAGGILGLGGSKGTPHSSPATTGTSMPLSGVGAYDPFGNNKSEHDAEAPKATDGNASTYWQTEHYNSGLGKPGVGVVLDAGSSVVLKSITVTTDTAGYTAQIRAGDSATGPFATDSSPQQVGARTTFTLKGKRAQYYAVWITNLGPNHSVHVNEVKARS